MSCSMMIKRLRVYQPSRNHPRIIQSRRRITQVVQPTQNLAKATQRQFETGSLPCAQPVRWVTNQGVPLKKMPDDYQLVTGSKHWKRKMRTVFKCLDANCDGYLTRDDYETTGRQAAEYLGLNDKQCEDVVKQFLYSWDHLDKDKVAEEEYVHTLFTIINQDSFRRDLYPTSLATNFNLIDTDCNGFISKEEHAAFYKGMRISVEEASRAFFLMDSDGDGCISLEDYAQAYLEFVFTEDPDNKYNAILGSLVE